jgi:hypothetical protein
MPDATILHRWEEEIEHLQAELQHLQATATPEEGLRLERLHAELSLEKDRLHWKLSSQNLQRSKELLERLEAFAQTLQHQEVARRFHGLKAMALQAGERYPTFLEALQNLDSFTPAQLRGRMPKLSSDCAEWLEGELSSLEERHQQVATLIEKVEQREREVAGHRAELKRLLERLRSEHHVEESVLERLSTLEAIVAERLTRELLLPRIEGARWEREHRIGIEDPLAGIPRAY